MLKTSNRTEQNKQTNKQFNHLFIYVKTEEEDEEPQNRTRTEQNNQTNKLQYIKKVLISVM